MHLVLIYDGLIYVLCSASQQYAHLGGDLADSGHGEKGTNFLPLAAPWILSQHVAAALATRNQITQGRVVPCEL